MLLLRMPLYLRKGLTTLLSYNYQCRGEETFSIEDYNNISQNINIAYCI
jgi:hypothetical protein